MSESIMTQALELLVIGMGFVFVFFDCVGLCHQGMSALVVKYAPPPPPRTAPAKVPASPKNTGMDDATLKAVISAAVNKYRSEHKKVRMIRLTPSKKGEKSMTVTKSHWELRM